MGTVLCSSLYPNHTQKKTMFWPDIVELRTFYRTMLGQTAARQISKTIKTLWPIVKEERILGLGYTTPYLRTFRKKYDGRNNISLAAMPAQMGVIHWPKHSLNRTMLCNEAEIPLPDASVDRVILAHALEFTDQAHPMLEELWRILTPGGRLLIIVPHRMRIWARVERSPFARGRPFTTTQLHQLLREALFVPTRDKTALYFPPTQSPTFLNLAPAIEHFGKRFLPTAGGVLLVEAEKQLYALRSEKQKARKRSRLYVPVARPVMPMKTQ
jgi:SAM-dependent methyltransferase